MSKGVSTIYGRGALFRSRPIWSQDPNRLKSQKRKLKLNPIQKLRELRLLLERQNRNLRLICTERDEITRVLKKDEIEATPEPNLQLRLNALTEREIRQKAVISKTEQDIASLVAQAAVKVDTKNASINQTHETAELDAAETLVLSVPIPKQRQRLEQAGLIYPNRDGQDKFREQILALYGRCALSRCTDAAALEAAHIIPYVNAASNLLSNGLCLRADIHRLYDRNLIKITTEYKVLVHQSVYSPEYRSLDGRTIDLPHDKENWPDPTLLAVRHQFVELGP